MLARIFLVISLVLMPVLSIADSRVYYGVEPVETIEEAHHEIHEGKYFTYSESNTITAGASRDLVITQPSTTMEAHVIVDTSTFNNSVTVGIYSNPSITSGTTGTTYNHRIGSANLPLSRVTVAPTVSSTGTQIHIEQIGAGEKASNKSRNMDEFIITSGQSLLIRTTASTGENPVVNTHIDFYEEERMK